MPIQQTNELQNNSQDTGVTQRKEQSGSKTSSKQGQKSAIQAKQTPIQAKQKPVQAKQTPIQRNESKGVVQRNGGDDLKERMSSQYKVDLSGYKEHPNSSFPASVGADATIQGNNIHYGPGKFTEQNRKHEFGHAIDNAKNGTPKGDKVINGKNIDTTREKAAEKIENTPVQKTVDPVQMKSSQGGLSSLLPIQRITTQDRQIRDKANVGVEVELRNITVTRTDRKWNKKAGLEFLTTGGVDGQFVTDQHQGKSAIIEWASGHPPFSQTNKGKDQQDQVDKIVEIVNSKTTGKLTELVAALQPHLDIGNVKNAHTDVKYKRNNASETQTQVNVEIPFENIGRIPGGNQKSKDVANLFTGSASKNARDVFVKSRKAARRLASQMLITWNGNNVHQYGNTAKNSIASLLTLFLHAEVNGATGGGKDAQGVLFKTGAGDLTRLALNADGKVVLWYCIHRNDNFIDALVDKARSVYKEVYKGRGGKRAIQSLESRVRAQAEASFKVGPHDVEKDIRWEDEHTNGGYTDTVDEDWYEQDNTYMREDEVDDTRKYKWADTRYLSGVKTGKTFGTSTHSSNDNTRSEKYLIAEVRRNDNEINKLVKMTGISQQQRNKLHKKIRSLQTPIR
ncbi:hypothetical protein BKI52_15365 [marine bacterium AO1-C]|nr:hypothetical protein BKI52_15365 [marine bacterium AO1-C]